MFRNSIFPFKITNLDIVKHNVKDIEMDHFSIYGTRQITSFRWIRNFPKYWFFLVW